jgi:hypothetical protein
MVLLRVLRDPRVLRDLKGPRGPLEPRGLRVMLEPRDPLEQRDLLDLLALRDLRDSRDFLQHPLNHFIFFNVAALI